MIKLYLEKYALNKVKSNYHDWLAALWEFDFYLFISDRTSKICQKKLGRALFEAIKND